MTGARVVRALAKVGWQQFSGVKHTILRHIDVQGNGTGRIAVPMHGTKPLARGTRLSIL